MKKKKSVDSSAKEIKKNYKSLIVQSEQKHKKKEIKKLELFFKELISLSKQTEEQNKNLKKENKKLSRQLNKIKLSHPKKSIVKAKEASIENSIKNSEESYRSLFNSVTEAIYIQDENGFFLDVNKGAELMYGYKKDEFIGKTPEFLSAPNKNNFEDVISKVVQTFKTGIPHSFEFWGKKKSGEIFPKDVSISKAKYFGKNCIIAVARDISERKNFIETIKLSEEKYRRIIETANEGIWTVNKDARTSFVNSRCAEMFGYKFEEMIDKPLFQFIFKEDIPHRKKLIERRKKGLSDQIELRFKKKDGSELWTFASIVPIFNDENEYEGSFGMFTDITERKKIEAELKEKEKRIFEIIEHSTNLFYTHDTNHLLTYVSPQTRIFHDCEPEEALVKWTEFVTSNPINEIGYNLTEKAIESGEQQKPYLLELRGKKGRVIWVEVNESPVVVDGKTTAIVGSLTDITERKKAEDALKESEEKLRKNNELLRSILESPKGIIIFSLDKNYRYTAFTLSHKETMKFIWGVDIEIGMNMLDAIKDDADREKAKLNFDKTLNGEHLLLIEEYGDVHLNRFFWEDRYSPIYDEHNSITGLTCFVTNITERIKAEKALQESEEKYRSIFENATEGIFRSTIDGKYIDLNNAMAKMLGYNNPQEVIESVINIKEQIFVYPQIRDEVLKMLDENNFVRGYETEFKRKDGNKFWVSVYIRCIRDEKNKILFLEGITQDISQRKQMIKELIDAKTKAEELHNLKSSFLANMSHELRTPLIAIIGFAEILSNEITDPRYNNMLNLLLRGGKRLSQTLNLILDLSKIEANKIDLKLSLVDIIKLTQEISDLYKGAAEHKGLKLLTSFYCENLVLKLDGRLYQEILDNLINNAIKYTNEGEIKIVIDDEIIDENKFAVIKVIDSGIGIPDDSFNKIFEEFRQVSEGINRSFEGTGLGLTITKKLVKLMNGEIFVESKLGVGSTFTVKFPFKMESEIPFNIEKIKSDKSDYDNLLENFKKNDIRPKILFVENDEATQEVISIYLKDICKVDIASTASAALLKVNENNYDAILMDINLGKGISGLDIIQEIRKIDSYSNVPIAAITAFAMKGDKEEFLSKGCNFYLAKPFQRKEFISFILEMLYKQN